MAFWGYILRCADGSYYTGHTDDLEKRLALHQTGEMGGYTSSRRPVALVYSQDFHDARGSADARAATEGMGSEEEGSLDAGRLGGDFEISAQALMTRSRFDRLSANGDKLQSQD
jgi:tRNA/rRNA methyltransferase